MYPQPMSFWEATKLFWTRAFDFSGRSRRKEYWVPFFTQLVLLGTAFIMFTVCTILIGIAAVGNSDMETANTMAGALGIFGLFIILFWVVVLIVLFIPNLSLMVRRLHDTGRSGKWVIVFYVIPLVLSWMNIIIANVLTNPENPSVISLFIQMIIGLINLGLAIWCIVWCAQDSKPGTNQWGPNPKGITHEYNPYQSTHQYQYDTRDPYRK
ncbi:DUF805 domain-containing protein [Macrococcus equi]|uniref:DUF805 domain-containing protein n=1 Tax=Macrococcus equi TaxID=3395462 RepID=UPI0039BEC0BD